MEISGTTVMNFVLTVQEANTVLAGLGKMPYEHSVGIISKIQMQADSQVKLWQQAKMPSAATEVGEAMPEPTVEPRTGDTV